MEVATFAERRVQQVGGTGDTGLDLASFARIRVEFDLDPWWLGKLEFGQTRQCAMDADLHVLDRLAVLVAGALLGLTDALFAGEGGVGDDAGRSHINALDLRVEVGQLPLIVGQEADVGVEVFDQEGAGRFIGRCDPPCAISLEEFDGLHTQFATGQRFQFEVHIRGLDRDGRADASVTWVDGQVLGHDALKPFPIHPLEFDLETAILQFILQTRLGELGHADLVEPDEAGHQKENDDQQEDATEADAPPAAKPEALPFGRPLHRLTGER